MGRLLNVRPSRWHVMQAWGTVGAMWLNVYPKEEQHMENEVGRL